MDTLISDVKEVGQSLIVTVTGEVTLDVSPQFHAHLVELVGRSPERLIIEMSGVGHIDSAGVGTLVEVFRRMKSANGMMFLVGLKPRVRGVFEITKLDRFFAIHNTTDEALKA